VTNLALANPELAGSRDAIVTAGKPSPEYCAQENLCNSFTSSSHAAAMIGRANQLSEEHWGTRHRLYPKARIE
jgi:hypothetical protein